MMPCLLGLMTMVKNAIAYNGNFMSKILMWFIAGLILILIGDTTRQLYSSVKCQGTYSWDYDECLNDQQVNDAMSVKGYY